MPDQVIQQTGLYLRGQPGVLELALDETTTFQHLAHTGSELLDKLLQIVRAGADTWRNIGESAPSARYTPPRTSM